MSPDLVPGTAAPSARQGIRRLGVRMREDMHRALEVVLQETTRLAGSPEPETRLAADAIAAAAAEIAARLSRFEESALEAFAAELGPEESAEGASAEARPAAARPVEAEDEAEPTTSKQLTRALAGELSQLARHADAPFAAGEADVLRPHIRRAARLANLWLTTSIQVHPPAESLAATGTTSTLGPRPPAALRPRPAPATPAADDVHSVAIVALTDRLARTQLAQAALRERAAARERYWRDAIHELRNAAHAFMSWGFVLRRSELKDTPWFAPLVRSAEAVLRRAEEALDPRHADAMSFTVQLATIELVATAREALESIRPAADARNISLAAATPGPGASVHAFADHDRVLQILHNLLRNAVSATPPGGSICISVSDDDGPRIEVEDTGPGVPDDVFQSLPPAGRSGGGFGLGLRLSRELAERMGGSLSSDTMEPGTGARFVLRLPPPTP
jgi:signal transduction histidine kinase